MKVMKEKESARRVASMLMLNAWRRARDAHRTNTESQHALEEQVIIKKVEKIIEMLIERINMKHNI